MEYVIFDLEWNQPYQSDFEYLKHTKMELTGEIIQIGAVKLDDSFEVIDTFSAIIKPQFLSHLHHQVLKLTGLNKEDIMGGVGFKQMIDRFKKWCGQETILLSWGCDDLLIMLENLRVHHIEDDFNDRWYDAQRIYGWHINQNTAQISVKRALAQQKIVRDLRQHDALNDAIYAAKILQKIPLQECLKDEKIRDIAKSPLFVMPIPLDFSLIGKFKEKKQAFATKRVVMSKCPYCGEELEKTSIEKTNGGKYMSIGECKTHGSFSIFWRVHKVPAKGNETQLYVTRCVSKTNKSIKKWYHEKKEHNRLKYEAYLKKYNLRKVQAKP